MVPFRVEGRGWAEAGHVVQSSDSLQYDSFTGPYIASQDDTWLQSVGAQFTIYADLNANLEGAFGFGAYSVNHSLATTGNNGRQPRLYSISMFKSFVSQAWLTYYRGEKTSSPFSVTVGNFSHNYNRDVKNLGLYLLRGPVYPGLLFGGYGDFGPDTSKANVLGGRIHQTLGMFSHDLIMMNEKDLPPTFDWSLAYIAKVKPIPGVEVGGGVNFYRLIPHSSDLQEVDNYEPDADTLVSDGRDTVTYTHQGIKLMAMFSLDPKVWISYDKFGPNDLKLYGEAAVLGVKDYGQYYDDITERMPVMLGFNLPVFGWLDLASIEVEWYRSPYRNDLGNIGNLNAVADWTIQSRPSPPSPIPVTEPAPYAHSKRDNWKWSLQLEKRLTDHVTFTGQVANDHYRPRPIAVGDIVSTGGTAEALTTPDDWYYMLRLGVFF